MEEDQVTFRNTADIRVQAQMSTGRTLVSTCLVEPGEIHVLKSGSVRHDIYFKNAAIGWKVASRRDNESKTISLRLLKGHFILS